MGRVSKHVYIPNEFPEHGCKRRRIRPPFRLVARESGSLESIRPHPPEGTGFNVEKNNQLKTHPPELAEYDKFTDKGKKKIAEICKAAAEVFYEKGYLSATLDDVASAMGGSKGAIYHYFSSKEDVLFLILSRYLDASLKDLQDKLSPCKTPHEFLYAYIQFFIFNYNKKQIESRLALNERGNLPERYLNVIKDKERVFMRILRTVVENVLAEEERNPKNIQLIARSLIGMLSWPYRWFDPEGEAKPEELARVVYKIFVGGIKVQSPLTDQSNLE